MLQKLMLMILACFLFFPISSDANMMPPDGAPPQGTENAPVPNSETATARVLEVLDEGTETDEMSGSEVQFQRLEVEMLSGTFEGDRIEVEGTHYPGTLYGNSNFHFEEGDRITVQVQVMDGELLAAYPVDHARDLPSYLLIGLFVVFLVVFGKLQGLKSVLTLGLTVFIIFQFMIPYLQKGYSPVGLAILTGAVVTTLTFLIVSGWSRKTFATIVGTVGGLGSAALISVLFMGFMSLTGFHAEEERMLGTMTDQLSIDVRGLLLAGIIIGALGAVMDVAISISSSLEEIKRNNPSVTTKELLKSGMNVGGDIMGTMANTLILAYVGASLPLLLLIYTYDYPFSELIQMEFFAVEILRTFAGSIGLILAIPITAVVSAVLMSKAKKVSADDQLDRVGKTGSEG